MNPTPELFIGTRRIAENEPVFVVAELSANHLGDYHRAIALVHAAAEAGADAVKLQTYTADTMTIDCDLPSFRVGGGSVWEGRRLYDLYRQAHTPWKWHPNLKREAERAGIVLFSTPFDGSAVDFLESLDVLAYKIASFELIDIPLLERVGATRKPVILSTGMGVEEEIDEAVATLLNAGAARVALLKCCSAYPAPSSAMNLRTITRLKERFGVVVGLSDHTLGALTATTAVALGARIIEKHLTLSRNDGGPDATFSSEPHEFAEMVRQVRSTQTSLGSETLELTPGEEAHQALRRSIYVVKDVREGETFTTENVRVIRPSGGLHPREYSQILEKRACSDIARGTPLSWSLIDA